MALKIAIIGLSPSHDLAPWHDADWQKWGLAWDADWPRMDRLFEMHSLELLKRGGCGIPANYMSRLLECDNLYMQETYKEIPQAIAYPLDEVGDEVGHYWNSSIGYMLALAIHEGAQEIALFGVDMAADSEYEHQRPNVEYLIGYAKGKGIRVTIADGSSLLKFIDDGVSVERYGWLG